MSLDIKIGHFKELLPRQSLRLDISKTADLQPCCRTTGVGRHSRNWRTCGSKLLQSTKVTNQCIQDNKEEDRIHLAGVMYAVSLLYKIAEDIKALNQDDVSLGNGTNLYLQRRGGMQQRTTGKLWTTFWNYTVCKSSSTKPPWTSMSQKKV